MKRVFVVVGPESAGNRIMTAALIRSGCDGSASQAGSEPLPSDPKNAVVLRSMPHGGGWPDLRDLQSKLERRGYEVTWIVVFRETVALARSQVVHGHARNPEIAEQRIREAYHRIFDALRGERWLMASIEAFVLDTEALKAFLATIGLVPVVTGTITWEGERHEGLRDENAKHYLGAT